MTVNADTGQNDDIQIPWDRLPGNRDGGCLQRFCQTNGGNQSGM